MIIKFAQFDKIKAVAEVGDVKICGPEPLFTVASFIDIPSNREADMCSPLMSVLKSWFSDPVSFTLTNERMKQFSHFAIEQNELPMGGLLLLPKTGSQALGPPTKPEDIFGITEGAATPFVVRHSQFHFPPWSASATLMV